MLTASRLVTLVSITLALDIPSAKPLFHSPVALAQGTRATPHLIKLKPKKIVDVYIYIYRYSTLSPIAQYFLPHSLSLSPSHTDTAGRRSSDHRYVLSLALSQSHSPSLSDLSLSLSLSAPWISRPPITGHYCTPPARPFSLSLSLTLTLTLTLTLSLSLSL
jgi:hypothetical protein